MLLLGNTKSQYQTKPKPCKKSQATKRSLKDISHPLSDILFHSARELPDGMLRSQFLFSFSKRSAKSYKFTTCDCVSTWQVWFPWLKTGLWHWFQQIKELYHNHVPQIHNYGQACDRVASSQWRTDETGWEKHQMCPCLSYTQLEQGVRTEYARVKWKSQRSPRENLHLSISLCITSLIINVVL